MTQTVEYLEAFGTTEIPTLVGDGGGQTLTYEFMDWGLQWAHELWLIRPDGSYEVDIPFSWDLEQQVDCYTMYWARKTFEDCPQFDLNAYHGGFGNSHPFINTKLGAFLDHLKGNERKRLGSSKIKDFKQSVGTDKSLGLGHGKKGNGMANTKWKKSDYWREAMLKERKLK